MLNEDVQAAPHQKVQLMTATRTPQRQRPKATISPFHRAKMAFLIAGFVSLALSVSLWFTGSREEALFVGLWVPAIHSLGALVLVGEYPSRGDRHA